MTEQQEKDLAWWTYLLKGKDESHLRAWYKDILKTSGYHEAEIFKKRVNYVNKKVVI